MSEIEYQNPYGKGSTEGTSGGWFKVPNALIRSDWFRRARTAAELKVLLYLMSLKPDSKGCVYCGLDKIGERTGLGKATVSRSVVALIRGKQIVRVKKGRPGWSSVYRVTAGCAGGTKKVAPLSTIGCASGPNVVPPARRSGCACESPTRLNNKTKERHTPQDGDEPPAAACVVVSALLEIGFEEKDALTMAQTAIDAHGEDKVLAWIDTVRMQNEAGECRWPKSLFLHFLRNPLAVDTTGVEEWRTRKAEERIAEEKAQREADAIRSVPDEDVEQFWFEIARRNELKSPAFREGDRYRRMKAAEIREEKLFRDLFFARALPHPGGIKGLIADSQKVVLAPQPPPPPPRKAFA